MSNKFFDSLKKLARKSERNVKDSLIGLTNLLKTNRRNFFNAGILKVCLALHGIETQKFLSAIVASKKKPPTCICYTGLTQVLDKNTQLFPLVVNNYDKAMNMNFAGVTGD